MAKEKNIYLAPTLRKETIYFDGGVRALPKVLEA